MTMSLGNHYGFDKIHICITETVTLNGCDPKFSLNKKTTMLQKFLYDILHSAWGNHVRSPVIQMTLSQHSNKIGKVHKEAMIES